MSKTVKEYFVFYTYKITNLTNNKIYFGETHNIKTRLKRHFNDAKYGSQNYLHRAIRKYGKQNFILEKMGEFLTEKEALQNEIELIAKYNSQNSNIGYNLTSGGDKFIFTDEVKEKMKSKSIELWDNIDYIITSFEGQTGLKVNDLQTIYDLFQNGVEKQEIAKKFGVGRNLIYKVLTGKAWGKILPFTPITLDKNNEELVYKVRQLVKDTVLTYKEIGDILDINQHNVKKMAKGEGIYVKYTKIKPIKENRNSITEKEVLDIRNDFCRNDYSFNELAKRYKISYPVIRDIIRGLGFYIGKEDLFAIKQEQYLLWLKTLRNKFIELSKIDPTLSIKKFAKENNISHGTLNDVINQKYHKFD